jgi:hypothetical protein
VCVRVVLCCVVLCCVVLCCVVLCCVVLCCVVLCCVVLCCVVCQLLWPQTKKALCKGYLGVVVELLEERGAL